MMRQVYFIAFLKVKDKYDDVMRFGKYHPDYKDIMLETRKRKRAYEMLPVVMEYKAKEVALQNLIDEVMSKIALAVSEHVKLKQVILSSKLDMMDVHLVAHVTVHCN